MKSNYDGIKINLYLWTGLYPDKEGRGKPIITVYMIRNILYVDYYVTVLISVYDRT